MKHWSIKTRIAAGFTALIALLLLVGAVSFWSLRQSSISHEVTNASLSGNLFAMERLSDHLTWVHSLDLHLLDLAEFRGQLDHRKCNLGQWLYDENAQRAITDPELKRLLRQMEDPHEQLHRSGAEIVGFLNGKNGAKAMETFRAVTLPALKTLQETFTVVRARYRSRTEENNRTFERQSRVAVWLGVGSALGAVATAILLAFLLTARLVSLLREVTGKLRENAQQVAGAAAQVSAAGQSLAQGASEQAASLEETSASSQEVSSMAVKNARSSSSAAGLVTAAGQALNDANRLLDRTLAAMKGIHASSGKIAGIMKVIDEIAFQTNILALNAAVEAARAGNAGMGFAVVADEVRNLAQRCAQAARDTSQLIQESIGRADEGKASLDQVAAAFQAVTRNASEAKTLVDGVELGSREQARGIEQIAGAVTQMEQLTQKTAASAEESAAAAESLTAQARALNGIVRQLSEMVDGAGATRGSTRPVTA